MKQILSYILVAGVFFNAGCSKKEETPPAEPVQNETISEQVKTTAKDIAKKTETLAERVTEKAETTAHKISEKIQTAVESATIDREDILTDLNRPLEEIKTEAANYDQAKATAYANGYKEIITEKTDQLAGLKDQLKGFSMGDLLGEKGKSLKEQISQYTSQLSGLKERYQVYLDMLKKYGVDLSAYGL